MKIIYLVQNIWSHGSPDYLEEVLMSDYAEKELQGPISFSGKMLLIWTWSLPG